MRSDLNRGCEACRLRLPSSQATCPNCGKATGSAALLLAGTRGDIDKATRNLLWGAPALAGILLSFPLGFAVFLDSPSLDFGAAWVGMAPIAIVAGALGVMLALACLWCVWGLLVWLGTKLVRPSRFVAVEVGVVPFPVTRTPRAGFRGISRAVDYVGDHIKLFIAGGLVLWWMAQVVAELAVAPEHFQNPGAELLLTMGGVALGELFAVGLLALPGGAAWFAFGASLSATVEGAAVLRAAFGRRRRAAPAAPALTSNREEIAGTVAAIGSVVAPLSGTPCAAFRIVGVVDGFVVDDAAAGELSIAGAAGRDVLRAGRVAVALDPGERQSHLDPEARDRLRVFLEARGLNLPVDDASVAEGRVLDGDAVQVWAARGDDVEGGAGYRDDARRVLDDSDGLPALIALSTGG